MDELTIRRFRDDDTVAAAELYFASVRQGTRGFYDEDQRQAWAPDVPNTTYWHRKLTSQTCFVAEAADRLLGFMTIDRKGHIDLAFVAPDAIGTGVAWRLYQAVEAEAGAKNLARLNVEASHLARRFFERQGWSVIREKSNTRRGVALTTFLMEKHLR